PSPPRRLPRRTDRGYPSKPPGRTQRRGALGARRVDPQYGRLHRGARHQWRVGALPPGAAAADPQPLHTDDGADDARGDTRRVGAAYLAATDERIVAVHALLRRRR